MANDDEENGTSASLLRLTIDSLRSDARFRKILQIAGPIVSAGLAGSLQAWIRIFPSQSDWILNAASFFLGTSAVVIAVFLAFFDRNGPDALKEAHAHHQRAEKLSRESLSHTQELEKVRDAFVRLARLYAALIPIREVVEAVITEGPGDEATQRARFGNLIDLLVTAKGDLFGIKDERWNFAIYLFNVDKGELECIACRRRDRADEAAPHRSWPPGIGHVGKAYQDAREYVADDVQKPGMRQFFGAQGALDREDDQVRYRSFAAVPIRMNGRSPSGVVIATSDVACRFWPQDALPPDAIDTVEPVRAFAAMLALIVAGTTLHSSAVGGSHVSH